jgi:hypothetical protein
VSVTPITWRILERPVARDGDSVYLVRERELARDDTEILIRRDPKRVLCRVQWLACPEISGPKADPVNGPRATREAQWWFDERWIDYGHTPGALTAVQHGFEKYGRPLVDVLTPDGQSFAQWMLKDANNLKGWPAYVE